LTAADAAAIKESVWARFAVFCKEGVGGAPRAAVRFDGDSDAGDWGLFQWAVDQVEMMTDDEVREQLGGHSHDAELAGGVPVTLDASIMDLINEGAEYSEESAEDAVPVQQKSIRMSQTDAGLADLVAQIARPNLRWCSDHSAWLARRPESKSTWDLEPGDGKIYRTVRTAIDAIAEDAIWGRFKKSAMSSGAIGGVAGLAKRDAALEVRAADLDSQGWVINSPSGVINLRTGLPFTEGVGLHTRVMGCGVADVDAVFHGMWSKFLDITFDGNVEMIAFMQRLAGWMAIGEIVEHVLPFFRGEGRNGKGVWLETVQLVLGSYAISAPLDFLMMGPKEHPTEIARLSGARMVICSEVEKNSRFAESKVKGLVGPDGKLTGRLMHGNWIDFDPTHSLVLTGNADPGVEQGGPSFWERLLKIPFDHFVKKEDRIGGLAKKMFLLEGESIARWIIQGCLDYQKFGLVPPPQVKAATEAYKASQDPIGRFADDCLEVNLPSDRMVLSGTIYTLYRGWCRETGERNELTQIALMAELEAKFQLGKFRNAEGRHRTGVDIKSGAIASYGMGMVRE
jgi:P4 family phage/plasmid primase-like protien